MYRARSSTGLPRGGRVVLLLLLLLLPDMGGRLDVLQAPLYPELRAEYGVEDEREEEARGDEGVADLLRGGEQAREAARNLAEDGERAELADKVRAHVLEDLGELSEEGYREGGELEEAEDVVGDKAEVALICYIYRSFFAAYCAVEALGYLV
jgi:hypothetical protein